MRCNSQRKKERGGKTEREGRERERERAAAHSLARSERTEVRAKVAISLFRVQIAVRSVVRPPFFFPERESQEMGKGDVTFLPSSLHLTMPNPLTCYSSRNLSTILLQNRSRQSFFVARFKGKGNRECIEEHHSQSALACPSFFD